MKIIKEVIFWNKIQEINMLFFKSGHSQIIPQEIFSIPDPT